jgi:hypothetical protein
LFQDGTQRRQAGATGDHEKVGHPPVLGQGELLADRCS